MTVSNEELYCAMSMVPGIVMALVLGRSQKYAPIKIAIYSYVITCTASIAYHLHNHYYGFNPRFLRFDFFGQNATIWTCMMVSPLGLPGMLCLAPFSLLSLVITNLNIASETFIAELTTAAGILITCCFNPTLYYLWGVTFVVFMIRKFRKNRYSHSLFHLLLHANMYQCYNALL